jgi:hypothetical protein
MFAFAGPKLCMHEHLRSESPAVRRHCPFALVLPGILLADRDQKIEKLTERIVLLEPYLHDLAQVKKRRAIDAEGQGLLFEGRSSEVESQADVEDEEETDGEDDDPLSSKRGHKKRSRQKLALSQLPTEERIHELPESERICPETGVPLVKVGEKVVEELHFGAGEADPDPPQARHLWTGTHRRRGAEDRADLCPGACSAGCRFHFGQIIRPPSECFT